MKYCFNCNHITVGDPLFCNHCGRSYDIKLCPRLHVNPRAAQVCSQCGSRDLSQPQPKVPAGFQLLLVLIPIFSGLVLGFLSLIFLAALIQALVSSPQIQMQVIILGIVLAMLWWAWTQIPQQIRKAIYGWFRRKRDQH